MWSEDSEYTEWRLRIQPDARRKQAKSAGFKDWPVGLSPCLPLPREGTVPGECEGAGSTCIASATG
jgi:hypothetical protein